MMYTKCLYCYQPLVEGQADFHPACSKRFFARAVPPILNVTADQLKELANQAVSRSIAVTGVQPKLSLDIELIPGDPKQSRLTIVGMWGNYILKPATKMFAQLSENEDLTMHLAALCGLSTAQHSLIRLASGEMAYITKRFDRIKKEKLAMEDMCQLTEKLTTDKYNGSMEQVGKQIKMHAANPGLDLINLFETTLFCFITGNADMHLKNFSLLTTRENEIVLSPGYDMLSTKLAMPQDLDETALTINGRKRRLVKKDFDTLAINFNLSEKTVQNSYAKFAGKTAVFHKWIEISFLSAPMKEDYKMIINSRMKKLGLIADKDV